MKTYIKNPNNLNDEEMDSIVTRVKVFLINNNNEILLALSNGGCQLPGGHREENEDLNDTIKREIQEETGIILSNRNRSVPWNIIGADTKKLPVDGITMVEGKPSYGVFGLHWPNVLHINPEKNMEVVASWTEYIKNCSEQFSTFISPDLAFTSNQLLYLNFADVQVIDNRIIIDVSKVPSNDEFCVNIKECIFKYFGCVISKFSAHTDFTTYKIKPTNPIIELVIK